MLMRKQPVFPYKDYGEHSLSYERRKEIMDKLGDSPNACGYITGGYSAAKEEGELYSGRK